MGAGSNPLAGTDSTLLALSGTGYMGSKLFGFASCPRAVGAAEGMNVLSERRVAVPQKEGARRLNQGSPFPWALSLRLLRRTPWQSHPCSLPVVRSSL